MILPPSSPGAGWPTRAIIRSFWANRPSWPDLQLTDVSVDTSQCPGVLVPNFRVINRGWAGVPSGVPVTVWVTVPGGAGRLRVGQVRTSRPLLPGESVGLELAWALGDYLYSEQYTFSLTINAAGEGPLPGLLECQPTNNDGSAIGSCEYYSG